MHGPAGPGGVNVACVHRSVVFADDRESARGFTSQAGPTFLFPLTACARKIVNPIACAVPATIAVSAVLVGVAICKSCASSGEYLLQPARPDGPFDIFDVASSLRLRG